MPSTRTKELYSKVYCTDNTSLHDKNETKELNFIITIAKNKEYKRIKYNPP
jgi:hypothetical protein